MGHSCETFLLLGGGKDDRFDWFLTHTLHFAERLVFVPVRVP